MATQPELAGPAAPAAPAAPVVPVVPVAPAAAATRTAAQARRPALIGAALLFVVVAIGAALYWQLVLRNYESTDNAYVGGHVVQVTPQIAGTVVAIGADDTDVVKAGQMLVRLDPADAQIALDQAEAQLAQAVRETRTLYTNNGALDATVALREAELLKAQDDLERRRAIADSGAVSNEELHHAEVAVAAAAASLRSAREQLLSNRANTDGTVVAQHPNVQRAAARVHEAFLATRRGEIVAPLAGQVARRSVQIGARVQPGAALMAVVPLGDLWVDANFKEVQLARMRIGQPVKLVADVYGSSVTYHGKVVGLGAGTGAAFALLPAQNATGNWVKVVQRVPVRIELDPAELAAHPLRIGLSVDAEVEVRDTSGKPVTSATPTATASLGTATAPATDQPPAADSADQTNVFASGDRAADELVARIIAGNLGGAAPPPTRATPGHAPAAASAPALARAPAP